jgi:hypothetical protein
LVISIKDFEDLPADHFVISVDDVLDFSHVAHFVRPIEDAGERFDVDLAAHQQDFVLCKVPPLQMPGQQFAGLVIRGVVDDRNAEVFVVLLQD